MVMMKLISLGDCTSPLFSPHNDLCPSSPTPSTNTLAYIAVYIQTEHCNLEGISMCTTVHVPEDNFVASFPDINIRVSMSQKQIDFLFDERKHVQLSGPSDKPRQKVTGP